ncbi:MAG: EpsG family protein [Enterococcus lacertideformus]|uniref:EpsG family protein n=1 Tax=Enterococcus lacertideformus TaxID=2771493 RepID=A0A931F818_9ENTE|nr:EpsG family protein [Enterococcus lacertideformus]
MITTLYFTVLITNLVEVFRNKKSRLLLWLSVIILGLIFAGGTENTDMVYYKATYLDDARIKYKATEFGFYYFVQFCRQLHLGLFGMRGLVFLLSTLLIGATVKKYCVNNHLFVIIYTLFLFFIDAIQLRNLLAIAIVIYSFPYLLENKRLKYFLGVMIASLFHTISLFYLPLLLLSSKNKKFFIQITIIGAAILELIYAIYNGMPPYINYLIEEFSTNSGRIQQYTERITTGSVQVILLFLLNVLLAYWDTLELPKSTISPKNKLFSQYVFYASVLLLMFIPLLWYSVEFYRLARGILPLIYISVINATYKYKKVTYYQLILWCLLIIHLVAWFYVSYFSISLPERIFNPLFYHNEIL